MIQTLTINNVLGQNRVGYTVSTPKKPRLRTHCAQAARKAPCRGALSAVSWPPLRPCRRRLLPCRLAHACAVASCRNSPVEIQKLYHSAKAPCFTNCASCRRPCCACTLPYRSAAARCIGTQRSPSYHDTKLCIATPQNSGRPRARVPLAPALKPAVSQPPPASRVMALLLGHIAPPGARPAALCHDTILSIMTQYKKNGQ